MKDLLKNAPGIFGKAAVLYSALDEFITQNGLSRKDINYYIEEFKKLDSPILSEIEKYLFVVKRSVENIKKQLLFNL